MNSKDKDFDWHTHGVWMAHDCDGAPFFGTVRESPYGCRAELLRYINKRWSALEAEGYTIQQYEPSIPVLTDVIKINDQVAVATDTFWQYPAAGAVAPAGVTVLLLTRGGVLVRGVWNDEGDYKAWSPMLKRDKELETRFGL